MEVQAPMKGAGQLLRSSDVKIEYIVVRTSPLTIVQQLNHLIRPMLCCIHLQPTYHLGVVSCTSDSAACFPLSCGIQNS